MFVELLKIAIHRAEREDRMIALMYIDLEGFKSIYPFHGNSRDVLERAADKALY